MADIAEVGTVQVSGSETAALTFNATKPTGADGTNLLVCAVSCPGNRTITPPTGWTLLPGCSWVTATSSGGDVRLEVYTAPGDVAAVNFGFSTSCRARLHTRCFSNVDPQIINASARQIQTTSSTTMSAPAVVSTVAGCVPLVMFALNSNGVSATVSSADARLTDVTGASASLNASVLSAFTAKLTNVGDTSAQVDATSNTAGKTISAQVLLWPLGAKRQLTQAVRGDHTIVQVLGPRPIAPYNSGSSLLTWKAPDTTGWSQIHVGGNTASPTLLNDTDYLIICDSKITRVGGLALVGGRNICMVGGEIDASALAAGRTASQMRGLYINEVRGDIFIEGLWIHGSDWTAGTTGALGDGIDINTATYSWRKTSVTLQNLRIDHVRAEHIDQQNGVNSYVSNEVHPDVVQMYGVLANCDIRIDKLTAQTSYQGIFCQSAPPNGTAIKDYRRIDIDGASETYDGATQVSAYLLYNSFGVDASKVLCQDVVVRKATGRTDAQVVDPMSYPYGYSGMTIQTGAIGANNVGAGGVGSNPGMGYVSPGYQANP